MSVVNAAAVNPNGVKAFLANGLNKFTIIPENNKETNKF